MWGGCPILDAVLVTNKVVDTRRHSKVPGFSCKLNIEKVCDHMSSTIVTGYYSEIEILSSGLWDS